jgi:molybdate transport system substrate-binding protein
MLTLCCVGAAGATHHALASTRRQASGARHQEVHVSAAVSLTEAMTEVAARFEAHEPGMRVLLNLAASNALARHAVAGATIDVFVSADQAQMAVIRQAGLVVRSVDLLGNELVVVVPSEGAVRIESARDLQRLDVARIAIGDPAAVPAGVYAKTYLERAGLWASVQPKLVPSASVRGALAALESGNVDAAIVYRTDASTARRARVAYRVAGPHAPRIVYPAALLSNADAPRRFFAFLQSAAAAAIFERRGFTPLVGRR